MLQRKMRLAALGLAAAITASSAGMQTYAANLSDVLPAAGIGLTVSQGTSLAKIKSNAVKAEYEKDEKRLTLSELELMVQTNKLSSVKGYATASSRIKDSVLLKDDTEKESVLVALAQEASGEKKSEENIAVNDVKEFLSQKTDSSQELASLSTGIVAGTFTKEETQETVQLTTTSIATANSDAQTEESKKTDSSVQTSENTSSDTADAIDKEAVEVKEEKNETEETVLHPAVTVSDNSVSSIAEAAIKGEDTTKPSITKEETKQEETDSEKVETLEEKIIETTMSAAEIEVLRAANMTEEEKSFEKLVIADVNDYVNVRDKAGEDGEIVGKLYDGSVGNFIEEENGWYKINSGSVTGFVKAEFCVTGQDAIKMAKEVGIRMATVETEGLRVREEASLDAAIIGQVPLGEDLTVSEQVDGWVKVSIEEGDGWVSTEYVSLRTDFAKAESKAEENARLEKEAEERRKAQEAASKKASESKKYNSASSYVPQGGGSSMGNAVAQYALQFVGNPYVYGGTSLTNGADCSGFVMSVYKNFGVSLPHSSKADRSVGYGVASLADAQPGDLICYSGHVALYIGDGKIVHASTSKTGIIVSNAAYKNILAIRRIF